MWRMFFDFLYVISFLIPGKKNREWFRRDKCFDYHNKLQAIKHACPDMDWSHMRLAKGGGSLAFIVDNTVFKVRKFHKNDNSEKKFTYEKKITDAGLRFAYHNHAFEFEDIGGAMAYDILIEEFPNLNFILDTYWVKYGGQCYLDYIKRIGAERMSNVHFKDMKEEPRGEICPCGVGVIDFAPVVELCNSLGIPNALVEQDNAPDTKDSFGQMKISCDNLKKYFG